MHKEQSADTILEVEKIIGPDSTRYIFERLYPGQASPASLILCFSQSPVRSRYFRDILEAPVDLSAISQPEDLCSTYTGVFDISEFLTGLGGDRQTRLIFDFDSGANIDILCKASDPTAEYGCQVTEQGYISLVTHLSWFLIGSLLSLAGIVGVEIIYAIHSKRKREQ